jgi:hypothetical protein
MIKYNIKRAFSPGKISLGNPGGAPPGFWVVKLLYRKELAALW